MTVTSLLLLVAPGCFVEDPGNPKAAPVPITGTVLDADRKPAAGVGVYDSSRKAGDAAALLPVAGRIAPALVPEFFWRAVSFRPLSVPEAVTAAMPDSVLALLLAGYDREVAMVLLQPILDRGPRAEDVRETRVVEAMAAIDLARAMAIVESLPDDPDFNLNPFQNPKNRARRALAAFLAGPPAERWDKVTHRILYLWVVGEEDVF